MKFTPEHYNGLKQAIEASRVNLQATEQVYKEKGLSETRFLWDIFWASNWHKTPECRESNYLDTHTQTAIKAAVKELMKKS